MEDSNLAQTVAALRKAVDPQPDGRSHIETVPRLGYRLAAEVVVEGADEPVEAALPPEKAIAGWRWSSLAAVGLAAALLAAALIGSRLADRVKTQEEASRLSHSAMRLIRKGTTKSYAEARPMLDRALELHPSSALAKAVVAELAARSGSASFDHAAKIAEEAVLEEPRCSECRAILGYILMTRLWKWPDAGRHLQTAVSSSDSSAQAHLWFGQWLLVHGRTNDAHQHFDFAIQKEPTAQGPLVMRGVTYYFEGKRREAMQALHAAEGLDPMGANPSYWQYHCLWGEGRSLEAATRWLRHFALFSGISADMETEQRAELQTVFSQRGQQGLIEKWLRDTEPAKPRVLLCYERAVWMAWKGDREAALAELEYAEKARPFNLIYAAVEPAFLSLRTEPRFRALVSRLGLAV